MARSAEEQVERWVRAMPAARYDIRAVWPDRSAPVRPFRWTVPDPLPLVAFWKARNAEGFGLVGRPADPRFVFLDDVSPETVEEMVRAGHRPCVVVESSPGNRQLFLDAGEGTEAPIAKAIARHLVARWGGDPGSADAQHAGRVPGFTNTKPKHRRADGTFPFAVLRTATPRLCPVAVALRDDPAIRAAAARSVAPRLVRTIQVDLSGKDPAAVYHRAVRAFRHRYGDAMDRSRADFMIARWMLGRGWSRTAVESALAAGERGSERPDYAARTVVAAAADG